MFIRGHIGEHMARYKIGEVSAHDMRLISENTVYDASAYDNNPDQYPDLLTNTRFNINKQFFTGKYKYLDTGTHTMRRGSWLL